MSDRNLEFWTTSPNVFLVATTTNHLPNMPGKIIGIIAYKKIGPNTAELSRLTVDMDYRRMKIGQRLIQALINTGKSLSEALRFAEHGENMLCTEIVLNVKNNFCTQHVLPMF